VTELPKDLPAVSRAEAALALGVVDRLDANGRLVLAAWTQAMMQIHDSPLSKQRKIQLALKTTFASRATWPIIKAFAEALRGTIGTARKSKFGRIGLVTVGAVALFGGQAAGIAALGGAIAVPLWVVVGGGYAFAEALQSSLVGPKGKSGDN
jgi:hypothetical protein